MLRVAVLASGNGTNFQALQDACSTGYLDAEIACVLSNKREPGVFERARAAGVETVFVPHKGLEREACDEAVLREIDSRRVDLVCHAGYMRIRGRSYCKALEGRVFNIHPSLLPSFPGAHSIQDAWDWGVKTSGITVHLATEDLDMGPVVVQRAVDISSDDSFADFEQKMHMTEYGLYPKAVRLFGEGKLRVEGRRVLIDGEVPEVPWAGQLPPGLHE